jgi:hypothetical protein
MYVCRSFHEPRLSATSSPKFLALPLQKLKSPSKTTIPLRHLIIKPHTHMMLPLRMACVAPSKSAKKHQMKRKCHTPRKTRVWREASASLPPNKITDTTFPFHRSRHNKAA